MNDEIEDINPDFNDEVYDDDDDLSDLSDDRSDDGDDGPSDAPSLSEHDKKILERYQDLDVADEKDEKEMVQLRHDRREFSEKLEEDPVFRAKYMASEKKRRAKLEADAEENNVDDIITRLQGDGSAYAGVVDDIENLDIGDSEMDEELEDVFDDTEELDSEKTSFGKPGVVIQHVQNLTINITIS